MSENQICDGTDEQVQRLTDAVANARAVAFKEASEFVRDAYFDTGLTVQEIAVSLAYMAEGERGAK